MQITDAMKAREFTERTKDKERARQDQAKALAEDQKRMGMIAQGLGLQKGEIDSMSRGELQGFITNSMQSKADQQAQQEQLLNLQKFMSQEAQLKAQQAYQQGQQDLAEEKFKFEKLQSKADQEFRLGQQELAEKQANVNMLNAVNQNMISNNTINRLAKSDRTLEKETKAGVKNAKKFTNMAINKVATAKTAPDPTDPQSIKRFQNANDWIKKNPGAVEAVEAGQGYRAVSQFQGKGLTDADFIKNQTAPDALHPQALKKLNDATAVDYADFTDEGGNYMMERNIRSLNQVIAELDGSNKTGRPIDFFGQTLRSAYDAMTDGDSIAMQQKIDLITQANLKATLGAQFTESEAKMFLQRSYDPERTPKENVDKLRKELNLIIQMAESRRARFQYFEDNNYNMAGFMTKNPGAFGNKGQGGNPGNPNSINTQSGNKAKISIPGTQIDLK
jgi:hypothetical protein